MTAPIVIIGAGQAGQKAAEALRKLGVDFGQGHLFGKPEPLDATVATLVERELASGRNVLNVG
jgi:EAL domain-containing protein (putative c-di-GMP-specific phosphodiesterase class I)